MDLNPTLSDGSLRLRPLVAGDLPALSLAASNPQIWAGHPSKNRYESEIFADYFAFLLASGGTLAIFDGDRMIGCSRFYIPAEYPDQLSIGFTFIHCDYWGGDTNRAIKKLMLGHAFDTADAVWFHIDPTNIRSQK